ncbi:1-acyl-sn-glycerol-3-phosphate acyltransferase [Candidatus Bipolaricaulota bacterium]|nr:1-acyl-sn-glycerol-3-phosphate acyltransferase [Candidatus Bipolaricaulota bacterium]
MREKIGKLLHKLGYMGLLVIIYLASKLFFRLKVEGRKNIPENTDDLVITSTHSSYWDPPLIGITFGLLQKIHFIAREGLLENPIFSLPVRTYSTTINRDDFGKKDLINMLKAFKQKGPICVFPEGTTSEGSPPKSGTVRLAEKTNRRFLPLKIEYGRSPTEFPFFWAPAEVTIGPPIDLEDLKRPSTGKDEGEEPAPKATNDKEKVDYQELSVKLMDHIRQL